MQKHHQRHPGLDAADPLVLELHRLAAPDDVGPGGRQAHGWPRSRSRSLKRWILPVAVLGSSDRKAMLRGYL